jgi:alkylhydroperoxidase/carboxymuconolactone decarboxylase family protein
MIDISDISMYCSKKHLRSIKQTNRRRFIVETYYKPEDLPKFPEIGQQAPELSEKFFDYYNAVFAEGALTEREKSLIALAVAHAVQCPYCIDAFTKGCLEKGSNLEEMTEAVHVVTAIRGGASLVHGVQMRNIAQKLSM